MLILIYRGVGRRDMCLEFFICNVLHETRIYIVQKAKDSFDF